MASEERGSQRGGSLPATEELDAPAHRNVSDQSEAGRSHSACLVTTVNP